MFEIKTKSPSKWQHNWIMAQACVIMNQDGDPCAILGDKFCTCRFVLVHFLAIWSISSWYWIFDILFISRKMSWVHKKIIHPIARNIEIYWLSYTAEATCLSCNVLQYRRWDTCSSHPFLKPVLNNPNLRYLIIQNRRFRIQCQMDTTNISIVHFTFRHLGEASMLNNKKLATR